MDVALFIHSRCCGDHWIIGRDNHIHCCGCGKSAGSIKVSFDGEPEPISKCCGAPFELVVYEDGSFGLACEQCQEFVDGVSVTGPEVLSQGCAACASAAKRAQNN